MQIAGRPIGFETRPPYIVAEISSNHGGQLKLALELIRLAAEAGADAVKFQAYEADTITLPARRPEFFIKEGPWKGRYLHDLYAICQTPFRWFPELARCADDNGITWFASVFDRSSIDMLSRLHCPAYKIASFELVDLPLIRHVAATGKPMILSTGMASADEIHEAVLAAEPDKHDLAVLHCVSGYPTPPGEAHLGTLDWLRAMYGRDCAIGISDHTTGVEVPIAATALGACIIEKHFKSRAQKTEDAAFSLAPVAFKGMVQSVRNTWAAMQWPPRTGSEEPQRPLRRSLFAAADIEAGEIFTEANVRSVRPGDGLPPKELENVLGKKAACAIEYGTPLKWDLVG